MSGYLKSMGYNFNTRGLAERSYTGKQILTALIGLITAAGLIAGGVIIIDEENKLNNAGVPKSDFYNLIAAVFIISGSLLVLFGLFKMFTKSE